MNIHKNYEKYVNVANGLRFMIADHIKTQIDDNPDEPEDETIQKALDNLNLSKLDMEKMKISE